jgi:hypothetical protein
VVERALKISDKVMFPRLNATFGTRPPDEADPFASSADLFNFDFQDGGDFEASAEAFLAKDNTLNNTGSGENSPGNNKTAFRASTKKIDPSIMRGMLEDPKIPMPRSNFATLPISAITKDGLAESLRQSRESAIKAGFKPEKSPAKEPKPPKIVPSALGSSSGGGSQTGTRAGTAKGNALSRNNSNQNATNGNGGMSRSGQLPILDIGDGEATNPHKQASRGTKSNTNTNTNTQRSRTADNRDRDDASMGSMGSTGSYSRSPAKQYNQYGVEIEQEVDGVDLPIFPFNPAEAAEANAIEVEKGKSEVDATRRGKTAAKMTKREV